jgi:hypothetical protein
LESVAEDSAFSLAASFYADCARQRMRRTRMLQRDLYDMARWFSAVVQNQIYHRSEAILRSGKKEQKNEATHVTVES